MATADEYVNQALQYLGVSGTDNIFNTWIWGHHCYDRSLYPWCAAFQSYVGIHDLSMPFEASASAAGVANQGARVSIDDSTRGDWVLFNWDGRQSFGWADHIGLVTWFDHSSGYFGTVEGNKGNEVAECVRTVNSSYATAFFRPPYSEPSPQPQPIKEDDLKFIENGGGTVYRLYNPNTGAHHLTLNSGEAENLANAGWNNEGKAFEAPRGGLYPVYRMYNPNNGDHLFTTSFDEAQAIQDAGWSYEGVPFFAQPSGTAIHRVYNPNSGLHVFTASTQERDSLESIGWKREGSFEV